MRVVLGKNEAQDEFETTVTFNTLDSVIAASVTELDCDNMLDFSAERDAVLARLSTKLRRGGRILIRGNDLEEICRFFTLGKIPLEVAESMLYGGRLSVTTRTHMVNLVMQLGLKILNVRGEGVEYYIVAERQA